MRRLSALLALFVVSIASAPVAAETLFGTGRPDGPPGAAVPEADFLVPPNPVVAPEATGSVLTDRNGNRVADGLEARLAAASAADRLDVVVGFTSAADAAAARVRLGAIELRREFYLVPGFSATMTVGQVRALTHMPGVLRVEEVAPVVAFMETARRDFGIDRVQKAPADGGLGYTGSGIGICIVDTGIFAGHEQFDSKVIGFMDFVGNLPLAYDDNGHGTHVASIAAGDGTGMIETDFNPGHYRGVAPGAELYAAKVLDANGSGSSDDVIAGIEWCAGQQDVDVINLSLGIAGSSDGTDLVSQAVDAAVNNGKVVVVAAGNSGAAPKSIGSPGAAALAITVGAAAEWSHSTLLDGESDGIYVAPFSSRGPTADGRVKPDIAAPGHSIIAAYINPLPGFYTCTDNCYASLSGTSMATPFTAGTVALMLEASSFMLTPADIRAILAATAQDRGALAADGSAVKDNDWGHGLLDGFAAVAHAGAEFAGKTATAFPAHFYGTGSVSGTAAAVIPIQVTDSSAPLAVAVTILSGAPKLFCDIFFGCFYEWRPDYDVRLRDPNGVEVAIGICMLGSLYGLECDNFGRQETVYVETPVPGTYTLEVYKGTTDSKNGQFSYQVSRGPLVAGIPLNNLPPIADAGPDQTVSVASGQSASVTLNGENSSDPDGSIESWVWTENGTTIATGPKPPVSLAAGTHTITLTVTDDASARASDTVVVTVKSCRPNRPNCPSV